MSVREVERPGSGLRPRRSGRRAMHPGARRGSSVEYRRYAPSSRLDRRSPRPSRCDAVLPPRTAKGRHQIECSCCEMEWSTAAESAGARQLTASATHDRHTGRGGLRVIRQKESHAMGTMNGTIKRLPSDKGCGFILGDDGYEVLLLPVGVQRRAVRRAARRRLGDVTEGTGAEGATRRERRARLAARDASPGDPNGEDAVRSWPRSRCQRLLGLITTSTRRLRARPSSDVLSATGCDSP